MRKRLIALSVLLCLVLLTSLVVGCAKPAPAPAPTPAPAPAPVPPPYELPVTVGITGGAATGSTTYALTCAIAPVMEKQWGIKVRVRPTEIAKERYVGLRDGTIHAILSDASGNILFSLIGDPKVYGGKGEGPMAIRVAWYCIDMFYGWLVRGDSDIKSFADIKGKRVVKGTHSAVCIKAFEGMLAFAGLTEDDVTVVPVGSWSAQPRAVMEGRADIGYYAPESAVSYEMEASPHGVRYLAFPSEDTEAWARYSVYGPDKYPAKCSRGVESALGVEMLGGPRGVVVHRDTDEGLVYEMVKFLGEQFADYKDLHPQLEYFSLDHQRAWLDSCPYPYHPGAIKYLEEKGIWTAEDDKWNMAALGLEKQYQGAWEAALKEAEAKGIEVDVKDDEWISLWEKYQGKQKPPRFRLD